jgi:outer membrane cobalamin receptor
MKGTLTGALALLVATRSAAAQEEPPDVEIPSYEDAVADEPGVAEGARSETLSIDEVLRTSVYAVSRRPQLVRESPGVVTVITREKILASGARDLIDVLSLVPGVWFGVDVQGVVGIGFRGNWAAEGKVLLLVDGHEMNELMYAAVPWGNHFPVDHIERIEFIRGPGSTVYGGFAELAVINVVTRGGRQLGGASASATWGQFVGGDGAVARRSLGLQVGDVHGDLAWSVSGLLGDGIRSTGTYVDPSGNAYSLADNAELDPQYVAAAAAWRGLSFHVLYDDVHHTTRDGFGEDAGRATALDFESLHASLQYEWRVGERLMVRPRLDYGRQTPWKDPDVTSDFYYDKTVARARAGLSGSWDPRDDINVLVGGELTRDRGALNGRMLTGLQTTFGDAYSVDYTNVAGYAQGTASHRIANVTVGVRAEQHSQFGGSLVARAGVTKVARRVHVKLLAARAFRAPAVENINTNPDLVPELTTAFEAEAGYQVSSHAFVSANLFDVTIGDPIVYTVETVDGMDVEAYANLDRAGTRGGEIELKVRYDWGHVDASASASTAASKNRVDLYDVPGKEGPLLGLPQLKATVSAAVRVWRTLTIAPTAIYVSRRYEMGTDAAFAHDPALLLNAFARYADLGVRGLDLGIGVYNTLDADYRFVQPYAGGHPSLPAPGREVTVRVAYEHEF